MRDRDIEQAQQLINDMLKSLADALEGMAEPLGKLERLLAKARAEKENHLRQVAMQRLDDKIGDYQHRPNGKHPIPGRFRHIDDAVTIDDQNWHAMMRRTHFEKSDQRRGRRNE